MVFTEKKERLNIIKANSYAFDEEKLEDYISKMKHSYLEEDYKSFKKNRKYFIELITADEMDIQTMSYIDSLIENINDIIENENDKIPLVEELIKNEWIGDKKEDFGYEREDNIYHRIDED